MRGMFIVVKGDLFRERGLYRKSTNRFATGMRARGDRHARCGRNVERGL